MARTNKKERTVTINYSRDRYLGRIGCTRAHQNAMHEIERLIRDGAKRTEEVAEAEDRLYDQLVNATKGTVLNAVARHLGVKRVVLKLV